MKKLFYVLVSLSVHAISVAGVQFVCPPIKHSMAIENSNCPVRPCVITDYCPVKC